MIHGDKLVIPVSERKGILEQLHTTHTAGHTMYRTAWEHVFWPGMKQQCLDYASHCETCAMDAPQDTHWVANKDVPSLANVALMDIVGCDIFYINNKTMVAIADQASGFIKCKIVKNETTNSVTEALEEFSVTMVFHQLCMNFLQRP